MKRIVFLLFLFAFSLNSYAQECEAYVPYAEGSTWSIGDYNAKGKLQATSHYEMKSVETSGNTTTYTIKMKLVDAKGKEEFSSECKAACVDGVFSMDMLFKLNKQMTEGFKNMELDFDASEFNLPAFDEPVGTTLPDSYLNIQASSNGTPIMKMNFQVNNRKIDSKEYYTTQAGAFDCIVITQSYSMKLVIKINGSTKEWYAKNVGMVRSESYNKNGKLQGYSELVALDSK